MEDQVNRASGDVVESYWLSRKAKREALSEELDKEALTFLTKACEFYDKNYPASEKGITYDKDKTKIPEISFTLNRDEAIAFRSVMDYYQSEAVIHANDETQIGRILWRVNGCIPDLARLNKIRTLEKKKQEMEKEIHRLKTMKEEATKEIQVEKELHFVCGWCEKEFVGATARIEIKEHILKCSESPTKSEEPKDKEVIPERLFTCQVCGIVLNRVDMKDHAIKGCKAKEIPKEVLKEVSKFICPEEECGKDCKNGAGLASHMKSHKKEE